MTNKIGDEAHGGIVFYVDETGEHGKVAALVDQSPRSGWTWYEGQDLCTKLEERGFTDWYFPTKDDLNLMYNNLAKAGLGGFAARWYWSSDVVDTFTAWNQNFLVGGLQNFSSKDYTLLVRAARSF
jgi:hypothetical protein